MVAESQKKTSATTLGLGTAFKGLGIKIKSATASLITFLTTNPVGWLTIIVGAIGGVALALKKYDDHLEETKQKIRDAADEAKTAVENIKSDFDKLSSIANDAKKKYAELSQEVENLGKANQSRGELSTEDYEEFLGLSNQLAELFPQLTKGYDDNGNAILNLSGDVDTIVGSLDNLVSVQQKLANQEIMKNMPDIWAGYLLELKEFNKELSSSESVVEEHLKWAEALRNRSEFTLNSEYYNNLLVDAAREAGIMNSRYGNDFYKEKNMASDAGSSFLSASWDFSKLSDDEYERLLNKLLEFGSDYEDTVQIVKGNISSANSGMASYINTWLSTEWNYNKMDSNIQNAVKNMLFNGDWVDLLPDSIDSGNWDEVSNWLQSEILYEINKVQDNEEISKALSAVFASTELTPDAKLDYIRQIQNYFGEDTEISILLQPQLKETEELNNQYQKAISKFGKESKNILESFFKDNSINDSSEIEYWNNTTEGIKTAEEAIRMYNKAKKIDTSASFSDIFSLKSTDDTVTNLGKISESIDTIQNAYKTLYDAIEEYNEEGAFSVDTLQSVIALGDDWLDYLVDEDGALKLDKESLEELTQARLNDMRVQAINNVIDNVSKVQDDASANEYLKTTNYALAESYEKVAQKALESARAQMQAAVAAGDLSQANMDAAMNKANADISKINKLFANTGISTNSITGKSGKSSSNSSSTGDYEEQFDFFERRVEVLDNAVSLLKANLENLTGSFAKNQLLDQSSSILEERMRNYSDAVRMYQEKAQESLSKLDLETQKKIIDGSVSLTDYIGEGNKAVVEAMNDYKGWSDKVAECTEELASLKEELRQLELDKFNHIIQDFTDQFDLRDNAKNLIDKQIDLFKEAGELIGESFYTAQIDQSQKQLTLLENEKAQLVNQMTSAIGSGRVQKGTKEWLEMVNALSDVDGNILDCKKSIEEFDNAILNLHTEVFNRIQEQFSNLDSEISNIIDLFDDFEASDDKGIWSKEGIAQLGLLSQQYELAQYRVQQYNDEIDKLNAQYLSGKYSATEYSDKLAELSSGQWDAVQASESAKDAIMDLNEARVDNAVKGIEKEIDAYKELIDAQLDALRASKDLHDYEKSIAEKTKSVTDLERQIAAMQNDTSAATVAKRKQLEQQLADAKADLEEAEYEHSVEVQEDALNKQYEAYEKSRNEEIDKLRESLNDKESILAESFNTVKNNASTVGQEIATIATQHGITVSKALISSWQSGENAIASYGKVLTPKTSAFVGNVGDIETEVYNLQEQADATAGSLAGTFSAKADALVTELITSYDAASNLALMTDALHNSLINTLQSGYDVSSLVNSLNAIADAANRAKIAVDRLGNLPSTNVPQSTIQHGITDGINTLYSSNNIDDINKWLNENKSIYSLGNVMTSASGSKTFKVKKYASGARYIEKDQLAITNEAGQELVYHATDGSILTPLRQGDKVFENEAVNRLWQLGQGLIPPDMTKNLAMPTVLPNNVNNSSVNVHYDSMITVQGSLNSTDVKQMEAIVDRGINKLVNKIHDGLTYGK